VHLLIANDFPDHPVNVGRSKQLLFNIEVRLTHCENKMPEGTFDHRLHTAQVPFYFTLRNTNADSPDFNTSIWLGFMTFDYRYETPLRGERYKWDPVTAQYIYQIPQDDMWGNTRFHDMEWHQTNLDIRPFILRAVETLRQEKSVYTQSDLNDLEIVRINFGWEIPGIFDAGILVRNISLRVVEYQ
jgi:hypothetical protein